MFYRILFFVFSNRDIALVEGGPEQPLNQIMLTDEDDRKIEEEENFNSAYEETDKITTISDVRSIEVGGTDRIKSKRYCCICTNV